jgi:hypothetical protein
VVSRANFAFFSRHDLSFSTKGQIPNSGRGRVCGALRSQQFQCARQQMLQEQTCMAGLQTFDLRLATRLQLYASFG